MKNEKKLTGTRIDFRAALTQTPPTIDFVLPGLAAGTVGMLAGTGSVGKTNFLLQLAVAVALGRPVAGGVWDAPESTGNVAILAAEDPAEILHSRVYHLGRWLSANSSAAEADLDALAEKVTLESLVGQVPHLVDRNGRIIDSTYQYIHEMATDTRLLFIDTFRRFYGGDENDSGAVTIFLQVLERIAQETSCAIVFTHHIAKAAVLNGQASTAQASRGSGALTDNIRWQAAISGMAEKEPEKYGIDEDEQHLYVKVDTPKVNYGPRQPTRWMRRVAGGVLERVELVPVQRRAQKRQSNSHQPSHSGKPVSLDHLLAMTVGGAA